MKLEINKKVKIILMKSSFLPVSFVPKIIFSKGIRKVIQTLKQILHTGMRTGPKSN